MNLNEVLQFASFHLYRWSYFIMKFSLFYTAITVVSHYWCVSYVKSLYTSAVTAEIQNRRAGCPNILIGESLMTWSDQVGHSCYADTDTSVPFWWAQSKWLPLEIFREQFSSCSTSKLKNDLPQIRFHEFLAEAALEEVLDWNFQNFFQPVRFVVPTSYSDRRARINSDHHDKVHTPSFETVTPKLFDFKTFEQKLMAVLCNEQPSLGMSKE